MCKNNVTKVNTVHYTLKQYVYVALVRDVTSYISDCGRDEVVVLVNSCYSGLSLYCHKHML